MKTNPAFGFLALICSLTTAMWLEFGEAAFGASANGWVQKRFDGNRGRFTVFISDNGACCCRNESAGWNLLAVPATKAGVVVYSNKNKNYFPFSSGGHMKKTSGLKLMRAINTATNALTWSPAYHAVMLGKPVVVWRANANGSKYSPADAAHFAGWEFWEDRSIKMNHDLVAFNIEVNGWPNTDGLPLRYLQKIIDGQSITVMDTISTKRAVIAQSIFDLPSHYKQVKSEYEVVSDTGQLNEMMQEWQKADGFTLK